MRIEEYPAEELGPALAAQVAEDLIAAIDARGRAGLAVPGGTTPVFFLKALGRVDLDWERVAVTLTDERWVPVSDARSNQRTLSETLFAGRAAAARFAPLYGATAEPAQSISAIRTGLEQVALPLDVCVLGMGEDGHTASLFPGSPQLAEALSPDAPLAMTVTAPGAAEPRVTLTLPVLAAAPKLYLLIKGAEKRAALERAMGADPMRAPVRAVLEAARDPVVFHAD